MKNNANKRKMHQANFDNFMEPTFCENLVISSRNRKLLIFNQFIRFVIICDLILSSYSYFVNTLHQAYIYVLSVFLSIQIILSFFTSFNIGCKTITDVGMIAYRYMTSYFLVDFLGTVPLFELHLNFYWLRFIRVIYLNEITEKIVKLFINKILLNIISLQKSTIFGISKFMKFSVIIAILLHVISCIWICLGRTPGSWISKQNQQILSDEHESELYIASLYWAMTAFAGIGYGDIIGYNSNDYIFSMIVFVFL